MLFSNYITVPNCIFFICINQNKYLNRLNAEAEMRIQLCSIKPDIKRDVQNYKTMSFLSLLSVLEKLFFIKLYYFWQYIIDFCCWNKYLKILIY